MGRIRFIGGENQPRSGHPEPAHESIGQAGTGIEPVKEQDLSGSVHSLESQGHAFRRFREMNFRVRSDDNRYQEAAAEVAGNRLP